MRCRNVVDGEPVFFGSNGVENVVIMTDATEDTDYFVIGDDSNCKEIASGAFGNVSFADIGVYISKSVTKFNERIFEGSGANTVTILYPGTAEEFSKIEKSDDWAYNSTYTDNVIIYMQYEYEHIMQSSDVMYSTKQYAKSAESFVENQEAVAQSLNQQLNVLRGELWYYVNFGLPLFEKSNKAAIDSYICSTVLSHQEVVRIVSFESVVVNHQYSCKMRILSTFGELSLNV